ncbi:MAG: hypothetical protein ICV63_09230 [Coleofasciculus sp. Co-bin14]|nr:hypothetical protein [Coleofasciculus sp. Co-bin14]
MKSKFFNLVTVSLATSILLAPTQRAFGLGAEPQANIKEAQSVVESSKQSCPSVNSKETHNQGRAQEGTATKTSQSPSAYPLTATSQTTNSSEPSSVEQMAQLSNTVGGVVVTLLLLSYILVGLQYRKYRVRRAATLLQQIETLERIWKMNPRQR